ncbi:MAG: 16S rRNA (guanine(966)-N(2))-methyltransferase RsmD [Planctomycetota bacterium]|nr:MAG: 16S rRNA (guanine(966)-N(2))-methyltransferase RsmD [Planctomycetota bacterium]REK45861.1 MAG: 16S rRNA (guanine(966)-N(2))-methyltransferase RsmD [Planctomycetota bacterium]
MPARARRSARKSSPPGAGGGRDFVEVDTPPRIIGGRLRGRRLAYSGRRDTRPMKHRVREAIFNLVGPAIVGQQAIDLFAGTGALGLEALSRGAARATFLERHFPTADVIRENLATLDVAEQAEVVPANAFLWTRTIPLEKSPAWVVFCSPPYDFYLERADEMRQLIERIMAAAPPESTLVVEADGRFDSSSLPSASTWDVRQYPPAVVAVWRSESQA